MILLKAKGQALTIALMETIASDFVNVCTVHWMFDERWDGMVKTAQYTQIDPETKERVTYSVLIDDATGCAILPNEIKAGDVEISAFGEDASSGQRITTVPVTIRVERSGFVGDGETPIPPSPDLYDQLLAHIADFKVSVAPADHKHTIADVEGLAELLEQVSNLVATLNGNAGGA